MSEPVHEWEPFDHRRAVWGAAFVAAITGQGSTRAAQAAAAWADAVLAAYDAEWAKRGQS